MLARTSNGLDVFRHYLPVKWRVGRNFLNPLYADSKASCNVYYDRRSGTYRMKDFGNGDYSGDCFFLVAKLKGLDCRNAADFVEVLHTIDRELCLGLDGDSPTDGTVGTGGCRRLRLVPGARGGGAGEAGTDTEEAAVSADRPEPKPYRAAEKPFTEGELVYWGASGITVEVLRRYGTVSLAEYRGETREGKAFGFSSTPAEPMFGYRGKWGVKVYRPMSEVRFVYGGHTGDNYCFGLEQLPSKGDLLFLTGGEKDVLTLAAHGFHAICFNSETSVIPAKTVRKLVYRFKHIVLLYDTDKTGLECSEKHRAQLAEYGVKRLVLPLSGTKAEKDVTDYFKAGHTREELMGLFLKLLDTLYGDTMAVLKSCEIDYDHPPEQAVAIVTAGEVPLGSEENILCITGGEGTGKSNYTAALVAGAIMERETDTDLLGVRVEPNRKGRAVLLYDTDKTGLECSEKHRAQLSEYGVKRLVLPLPGTKAEKDVTDYFKAGHTREELMGLFLKLLDTLYGDTMAVLKSCEIDYDHPPEQAVAIVTAGEVPLGSEENILCITGGEGTGKSNYTAALVAGAIMERETDTDLLGVRVEPNRKGRAVLLYDTEQSEQQLYKNTGRLLRRAGRERMPEYLHVYCLTGMSRSERLTAIVQSMDKYHYLHGGIHLVVIDGVADLIRCANDEAESVALIDEIYRLAGIYRTCIAAVVHFVPNGLKLRGHLGSELQRKSAAILSIEKDENPEVSVVKALKVRDGSPLDIPLMQFRWDKQAGMPVYVGEKPRAEKEKRKEKELAEMAREAFARQEKYGYIELCELIQEMLEVKERTAKGYIRYMREKEIIEKEGDCYVHGQGRV